jgi:beta-glucosidase-like glycosyl hydrolase
MPPTQQHAHQGLPTDLDLALEARANVWGLPPEDRDAILRTAELLGCDIAAARIRDAARRRARVQQAPPPAPRPGPKPKPTAPRAPLLNVLTSSGDMPAPDDIRRTSYGRLVALYDDLLTTPGLDEVDHAALRRQRHHAALAAGQRPLAPARGS